MARQPASMRVIELIQSRIKTGEYVPGQYLLVGDLMTELGLSKAPIREAIHVLVGEGVLELLPNRSARIRVLTTKDILDFSAVWAAVGGVNIRLGTEALRTGAQRKRVRKALDRILASNETRNPYDYFAGTEELHQVLSSIADNHYINEIIGQAHFSHYHRYVARIFPGRHWRRHIEAFRRIGAAILGGDGSEAERRYRKHLGWVVTQLGERIGHAAL
jgi:DNA-binding GntR family transcriptional regulator